MNGDLAVYLIPLAVGIAGFLVGRFTAPGAGRARQLGVELEATRKDHERVCAELEAAHSGQEQYRGAVADHFVGTADRLRDLALQYRSVFDHLAGGARDLCPERFDAIESPMHTDLLTEATGHDTGHDTGHEDGREDFAEAGDAEASEPIREAPPY